MYEFDEGEKSDLKLTTSRFVAGRQFRFVMMVARDTWESFLAVDPPEVGTLKPRDAYEKAKDVWERSLQEIADQEALRMDVATAVGTHTFYPSLDWLEKRR